MLYVDFLKITYKENVYVTVFEMYENFAVYFSASLVLAVPTYLVLGRFITSIIEYFVIKVIIFFQDKEQ